VEARADRTAAPCCFVEPRTIQIIGRTCKENLTNGESFWTVPACGLGVKVFHDPFDYLEISFTRPISASVPFAVHTKEGNKPRQKHESANERCSPWEGVGCASSLQVGASEKNRPTDYT